MGLFFIIRPPPLLTLNGFHGVYMHYPQQPLRKLGALVRALRVPPLPQTMSKNRSWWSRSRINSGVVFVCWIQQMEVIYYRESNCSHRVFATLCIILRPSSDQCWDLAGWCSTSSFTFRTVGLYLCRDPFGSILMSLVVSQYVFKQKELRKSAGRASTPELKPNVVKFLVS